MAEYVLDWNKYISVAIRAASEGAVLVRNENSALPVMPGTRIALFGRMQSHYYKSGTGSGGMVNVSHVTDIREGLEKGGLILDTAVKDAYDEWEKTNPVDPGLGWGKERWSQDEMPLEDALAADAASRCEAAVVIIARTAGEDRDNTPERGSYYLNEGEEQMLQTVTKHFRRTIVLLNVGNIIDMSFVDRYSPAAVMYVWQAGMIGGTAAADVVTGKTAPSGCLTDTIAYSLEDYPSSRNFGNRDIDKDYYEEDIFVGYRYFSTFAPDKVRYPFGYGLTYSEFDIKPVGFSNSGTDVKVDVEVTNTGSFPGRKTVMLFASAPQGVLGKPERVLAAFTKTPLLNPGDSVVMTMTAGAAQFASFDDDGRAGYGTAWLLEAGQYVFLLGENARDTQAVGGFTLSEDIILEKLESALAPVEPFDRLTAKGSFEPVPVRRQEHTDTRLDRVPAELLPTGDRGIKLADVYYGRNTMDEFVAQLEDEELALIIRGEGMSSPKVTTGTAGAFGGVSRELMDKGIPTLCCSDGPSGMRIDSGKKAFALPNGTCLACTYDEELISELFEYFGIEMLSNKIDTILGPGINIHRHPLNGRNFEYFSEDPYLTGRMAVATLAGVQKNGASATIKHFCLNNRETHRRLMDSVASERALREIYLKPFEIAIRDGQARSIMSVYNRINGTYGTANYEANTMILREQLGYRGIVMTDWWAFINIVPENKLEREELFEHSLMARSQCDLYMVCSSVERDRLDEADTYRNIREGRTELITRAELQRNAANILNFAMTTPAMRRILGEEIQVNHIDCPFGEEKVDVKVENYYKIEDEPLVTIDTDTSDGSDFMFGVDCSRLGRYDVRFTASSPLNSLAQIPMTLYYTSIPIRVITWNGTEGASVSIDTTLRFTSQYSVFRVHFGAPGVKLESMEFSFRCSVADDPNPDF